MRGVLKTIKEKEGGKILTLGSKSSGKELFDYLAEVLPDYSRESVYASDVKKMIAWYNLLIEHQIDLEEEESSVAEEEKSAKDNASETEDITEKGNDN